MTDQQAALACDLAALAPAERERHGVVTERLFAAVRERRETPDGVAFGLPPERALVLLAAEFITREACCCPFFRFTLELQPHGEALWLRLEGGPGVKAFLQAQLGLPSAPARGGAGDAS
jgi:hypothetical protein